MFNELKWLSFPTICIYYTHIMIFKSLNNQTPTYVKELLTFSNNSFYNLRSTVKKSIVNDKPNTKFKSNSFSYFGMKTWNELPKCIINSPSVESFIIRLKLFSDHMNISNITSCQNACHTFYVNSYIHIIHVLMMLGLSISCHHLHPHPPNM